MKNIMKYLNGEKIVTSINYMRNHWKVKFKKSKKKSIEFIKEYKTQSDDYVLIAVRVSNNGVHFARTMYIMADEKVEKYLKHDYFHKF